MSNKKKAYKYKKASFVIGHKPDGTPVRKYVYGKTISERNSKLAEAKRLYARGLHLGEMTVAEWSERCQAKSNLGWITAGFNVSIV